jgi:hypothetical protein
MQEKTFFFWLMKNKLDFFGDAVAAAFLFLTFSGVF